jgi:hypothetical protein
MDGKSFDAWLQGGDVSTEGGVNLGNPDTLDVLETLDNQEKKKRKQ